jgi:hypothetical protein
VGFKKRKGSEKTYPEFSGGNGTAFLTKLRLNNTCKMRIKPLFELLFAMAAMGRSKSNNNTPPSIDVITAAQVPAPVMSTYNSRYPSASGQIEWEREDGNTYKVKFLLGAQRWQAPFVSRQEGIVL